MFSYQKDLGKYRQRIRSAKSKAVRDAGGEKYLEAQRYVDKIGTQVTVGNDSRITRVGKLIRKSRLGKVKINENKQSAGNMSILK